MKVTLFALFTILFSTYAQAQSFSQASCRVDLVNSGHLIRSFYGLGANNGICQDAQRDCNRERHLSGFTHARCVVPHIGRPNLPPPVVRPLPPPHRPLPMPQPPHYPQPLPGYNLQVGDIAFPYSWDHAHGATILSYSPYNQDFRVRSNKSGQVYTFAARDLGIARGCQGSLCVGQRVFPESWDHAEGGVIVALFLEKNEFYLRSNKSGSHYKMRAESLAVDQGCIDYLCVGQQVFPRSWNHAQGGKILAINPYSRLFTVRSNQSGNVYKFSIRDL